MKLRGRSYYSATVFADGSWSVNYVEDSKTSRVVGAGWADTPAAAERQARSEIDRLEAERGGLHHDEGLTAVMALCAGFTIRSLVDLTAWYQFVAAGIIFLLFFARVFRRSL